MKGALDRVLRVFRQPRAQLGLKLVVSLTLVSWLVYATDREALGDALLEVDGWSALPAVLLLLALIVVQAWRWTFVTRALGLSLSLPSSYVICHIPVVRRLAGRVLVQDVQIPQLTRRVFFHAGRESPRLGSRSSSRWGLAFTVWLLARAAGRSSP